MRWASSLSRRSLTAAAFQEAATALEHELQGGVPDLLLSFFSPEHAGASPQLAGLARERFPGALLVGCTAGGVIGAAQEAEDGPALSLTAAELPGAELSAFHVGPPGSRRGAGWLEQAAGPPEARPSFLLLADPFTADVAEVLEALDRSHPGAAKFGGLASGGQRPTENRLLLGGEVHDEGLVGVAFRGAVEVETLIAQGCRPIGLPMVVTRCAPGLLQEVDGRPPFEVMSELYGSLDRRDRELMRHSLFIGLEVRPDEGRAEGEVLVRNLLGVDRASGAIAVGGELRRDLVAQFVLRDAHAAEEELRRMLVKRRRASADRPAGALLFSCVGRGAGLFGHADHDTSLFEEQLGPAPLGGFFCNGEIGPVGGRTYLHGYTSAFALFREPRAGGERAHAC